MTDNLQYKGIRSTRLQLGVVLGLGVTAAFIWGDPEKGVTAAQWIEFIKWDFGIYALSEVGAKGASAYKERP